MVAASCSSPDPPAAQEERQLQAPADLHKEPDGAPLVSLPAGAPVEAGKSEGDWREVTVEGWIFTGRPPPRPSAMASTSS